MVTASFNLMHSSNIHNASDAKVALLQPSPIFISIGKKDIPIQMKRI
ncbi:hypothetical protein Xoosp13_394 [Xanthomonas phage Xoo-sp13]|nr:hypothetical protein Xoosp13_394 [Xanthomonas phage Xoo-sp13]